MLKYIKAFDDRLTLEQAYAGSVVGVLVIIAIHYIMGW